MGSIHETHLNYVEQLKARGEKVLKPKCWRPFDPIDGYVKTQIPHKDVGSIFKDKDGKYGLYNDFGALYVTGIEWCDLGLCDSRCWYEWMDPELDEEKVPYKYSMSSAQNVLNIRASEIWDAGRINIGEMADLQIMLDQIKVIFGQAEFDEVLAEKYAARDKKLDSIESGKVVL